MKIKSKKVADEWISVIDELPNNRIVLCVVEDADFSETYEDGSPTIYLTQVIGYFNSGLKKWYEQGKGAFHHDTEINVKFWMPLPAYPESTN